MLIIDIGMLVEYVEGNLEYYKACGPDNYAIHINKIPG